MDSITFIKIPSSDGLDDIEIKVKRPQLMAMMSQGRIPNHLLGLAAAATIGKPPKVEESKSDIENAIDLAKWIAFYCEVCMVEPKYEEVKEYITDDQAMSIYVWAIAPIKYLRSFRNEPEDGSDNRDGETL